MLLLDSNSRASPHNTCVRIDKCCADLEDCYGTYVYPAPGTARAKLPDGLVKCCGATGLLLEVYVLHLKSHGVGA
jgi:hypothetical protein